jgi:putative lipoprotein (rSAM/lipoprotein system)
MRKKINLILGALIAVLGGCKTQDKIQRNPKVVALYGVPFATYNVSGKVVNEQNKPIKGAKVVVKGNYNQVIGDTVITNNKGQFEFVQSAYPSATLNIVVCDPQSELPVDSVQHSTTYQKKNNERAFDRGNCTISTEIKIK